MPVGAVNRPDLAFVAFDDVEVGVGEDGLDGGAAEGGGAGSVVVTLVTTRVLRKGGVSEMLTQQDHKQPVDQPSCTPLKP